jgi:hypothetical protein
MNSIHWTLVVKKDSQQVVITLVITHELVLVLLCHVRPLMDKKALN